MATSKRSARKALTTQLFAFVTEERGGVALHYALVASAISLAAIISSHHAGQKVHAQLEAVLSAMQKPNGLNRLIP